MGKSVETAEASTADIIGYDGTQFEWETVHTEAPDQIVFETPGDCYIGLYVGWSLIYPDPDNAKPEKANAWFIQLHFTDPGGAKVINAGYDLRRAYLEQTNVKETTADSSVKPEFKDVIPPQTVTRNLYAKDVDVDQNDPMKSFRVDAARPRSADNSAA